MIETQDIEKGYYWAVEKKPDRNRNLEGKLQIVQTGMIGTPSKHHWIVWSISHPIGYGEAQLTTRFKFVERIEKPILCAEEK